MEAQVTGAVPVRGTQSFVHTLSECWRRPSLTALEVAWRWVFGIPAGSLLLIEGLRVWRETPFDAHALNRLTLLDPIGAAQTLARAAAALLPPVLGVTERLAPALLIVWVAISAVGRTFVLRRFDARLHSRLGTLMILQALRVAALAVSFAVWFLCLCGIARVAVNAPIAAGQEPNLVLYFAAVIVTTLGLFIAWAVVSWALSVAPLLAVLRNLGAHDSLAASFRIGPVRSKLVEINLVMGIVKIALIVLAMVFSACPLPFESVATPEFMLLWYAGVTILYFVASDFFHVARLVAYLELWRAYDQTPSESKS